MTVPSLFVVFVLWVGYTAFWANKYESDARRAFEENGRLAVQLFSGAVADALWEFDVRSAQQTLSGLAVWPGFLFVTVNDAGGEFSSYETPTAMDRITIPTPEQFGADGIFHDAEIVYLVSPIMHAQRHELGHLVAAFDQGPLLTSIAVARRDAIRTAALGFTLLSLFLGWTARSVSGPLLRITRAVEKVADGDLEHAVPDEQSLDEVARLANALEVFRRNSARLLTARAEVEANRRVAELALLDDLTGLVNRRAVVQRFAEIETDPHPKAGLDYSVIQIDLDGFKPINDTLGHSAGDHVLQVVASRLLDYVQACDLVARIGGDEFVLLIPHDANDTLPQSIATSVLKSLAQPVSYHKQTLRVGASAGIAGYVRGTNSLSDALVHADIALYRAKSQGKGRFVTFDQSHSEELIERSRRADEILQGVEHDQFVPYFQPIVDAQTHQVVALELLARWNHPTRGVLPPTHFLDLATDLDVMRLIDAQVFARALDAFETWQADGMDLPRLCINVSNKRLLEQEFIDVLVYAKGAGIEIDVELLETIYLDDPPEQLMNQLDRIRMLGIGLNIDDFGTGHASVAGLIQIDPDKVKIDRRFIVPILESKRALSIVQALLGLCALLDIDVVAEGVEDMEQADLLRRLGCRYLQGYAFMKPISASAMQAALLNPQQRAAG